MVSLNKADYNIPPQPQDDGEIYPNSQPHSSYASFGSNKPYAEPNTMQSAMPSSAPLPEITPVHSAVPQGYKLCSHCEKLYSIGASFCPACGAPADGSARVQPQSVRYCPSCGSSNPTENMFCSGCGASLNAQARNTAPQPQPMPQQQPVIVNNYYNNNVNNVSNVNSGNNMNVNVGGKTKDKWVAFLLCFFLGVLGVHKFYEGKIIMGLVYLFTGGLFGIGWIVDLIVLLCKPNPYTV